MKKLLATCLSLIALSFGCGSMIILSDQPDGESCSFWFNKGNPTDSWFVCNRIKDPSIKTEYRIDDPHVYGLKGMPIDSFKVYQEYVFKLREEIIQCRAK